MFPLYTHSSYGILLYVHSSYSPFSTLTACPGCKHNGYPEFIFIDRSNWALLKVSQVGDSNTTEGKDWWYWMGKPAVLPTAVVVVLHVDGALKGNDVQVSAVGVMGEDC